MHLRESRTSKFSGGACPRTPPRVEGAWGLRQIYPPVTLKYPLMQKLIETPVICFDASCLLSLIIVICFDASCLLSLFAFAAMPQIKTNI